MADEIRKTSEAIEKEVSLYDDIEVNEELISKIQSKIKFWRYSALAWLLVLLAILLYGCSTDLVEFIRKPSADVKTAHILVIDRYDGADHTRIDTDAEIGSEYSYNALDKDGYTVDVQEYHGILEKDLTIVFNYTKVPVKVTTYQIEVIDRYDGVNHPRQTDKYEEGESYSYKALDMDGYTADKESVSGKADSNKTIIFNYTKKVTIKVVDQYDGEDHLRTTDLYEVGDEYSYEALSLEGYTANQSSYSGIANEDYTVVFKYTKNEVKEENVNITVIDAYDGVNHTRAVDSVKKGSAYSYDALDIEGYTANTSNLKGVADKDITLVFKYSRNKAQYKVTVIDSYDDADHTRCVDTYTEGTSYSYNALNLSGYTADKSTATGTVNSDLVVKFTYTKDAVPTYTVTVIDKYDGKSHTRTVDTFEKGATYRYYALDKNGYEATPKSYSGEVTKNIELVFEYSRTAHTITVIDRYDGEDHVRTTDTKQYGDSYSYTALSKTGYTVDVPSYIGTMGTENKTLVFTYTKDKAKYTIIVVDKYDGSNHTRSVETFTEGDTYSYSALNKAGYTVDVPSYSGTVSKDLTLTFTYTKEPVLPATYTVTVIDNYDGVDHTRLTEQKEEGSTYSYNALNKAGYTVDNNTLSGTVNGDVTVKFTYTKDTVYYTITVIDRYDGADHTRLVDSVAEGTTYSYSALSKTGYRVDVPSYTGTATGDKVLVFTYTIISTPDPVEYTVTVIDTYDGADHIRLTETKEEGCAYSYDALNKAGYTVDNATKSGVINGDVTVKFTYTKNPVYYTITVVDNYDGEDHIRTVDSVLENASYSYDALVKPGYTVDHASITGTATEDKVIKFTYTVNAATTYTITVYDNVDGVDNLRLTDEKEEGSPYSYDAKELVGYTVDHDTISGTVLSDTVVRFTYTKNSYTITVVDSYDGADHTRLTETKKYGDSYSYNALDKIGYTVNSRTLSGTVDGDITVKFTYTKNTYTITVIDKYDGERHERLTETKSYGDSYSYDAITISGYTPEDETLSGVVTEDTTVIFYYSAQSYTITVKDSVGGVETVRDYMSLDSGSRLIKPLENGRKYLGCTVNGVDTVVDFEDGIRFYYTDMTEDITIIFYYGEPSITVYVSDDFSSDNYSLIESAYSRNDRYFRLPIEIDASDSGTINAYEGGNTYTVCDESDEHDYTPAGEITLRDSTIAKNNASFSYSYDSEAGVFVFKKADGTEYRRINPANTDEIELRFTYTTGFSIAFVQEVYDKNGVLLDTDTVYNYSFTIDEYESVRIAYNHYGTSAPIPSCIGDKDYTTEKSFTCCDTVYTDDFASTRPYNDNCTSGTHVYTIKYKLTNYTGGTGDGGIDYDSANTSKVKIYDCYDGENHLREEVVCNSGQDYTFYALDKDGYIVDKDSVTVTGTADMSDIYFFYTPASEYRVLVTVNDFYNGTNHIRTQDSLLYGSTYSYDALPLEGELAGLSVDEVTKTGTVGKTEIQVKFTYTAASSYTVTVYDNYDGVDHIRTTDTYSRLDSYEYDALPLEGSLAHYTVDNATQSGTVFDNTIVRFTYTEKPQHTIAIWYDYYDSLDDLRNGNYTYTAEITSVTYYEGEQSAVLIGDVEGYNIYGIFGASEGELYNFNFSPDETEYHFKYLKE